MDIIIRHLHTVPSTNSYLREWSNQEQEADLIAVYADSQTSGRGQRGNVWESEPGKNLTMSLMVRPSFIKAEQQFILSQLVSLAIEETLSSYTDGIRIKWPNDIYWKDKKICGILIENDLTDDFISRSIIGIGLNVNQEIFHSNAPNPVSLTQITGISYNLEEMMQQFSSALLAKYTMLATQPESVAVLQHDYAQRLYRKEGFHPFEDQKGRFEARIHRVKPSGLLVLESADTGGLEEFAFKEVKFLM